jgi:(p)ppGpp synthase/HD superfamily hydrolase
MTNNGTVLIARAADFAARRHADQKRKGVAKEPYINHLTEVAGLLAEATAGKDAELVAAGLLHDTLEDTQTEFEELSTLFGKDVAKLVSEVTDDKSLPKATRKRLQIAMVGKKSRRARLIKLADKTSNLRSLALSPPADWDSRRAQEYVSWSEKVIDGCRGLKQRLDRAFDVAAAVARAAIGQLPIRRKK